MVGEGRPILKAIPGISGVTVYWISTRFRRRAGASGSAQMSPVLQFGSAENVSVPEGYDRHCGRWLEACGSSKGEISAVQTRLGVFAADAIAPEISLLSNVLTSPGYGSWFVAGGDPE